MNDLDSNENTAAPQPARRRVWQTGLSYLFALACLVWVFHDVDLRDLRAHLGGIHWGWVALAVVADILSYLCQGWRWRLLLPANRELSVLRATEAVYAGLFVNEILPLRPGELVRMFLVSRWLSIPFLAVVPSIAVERLFDGIWVVVGIALVAIRVPLPRNLLQAGDVLGVVMLAAIAIFMGLLIRERRKTRGALPENLPEPGLAGWLKSMLSRISSGIAQIGMSRSLYASFAISFLVLGLQAVAFWLMMWGYGMRLSFWHGFAVLLIVHLGTAIPNTPANVGSYQFFVVAGLLLFGVEKAFAAGFSVVVFVVLTIPLWVLGWLAISRAGMTLAAIRDEMRPLDGRKGA